MTRGGTRPGAGRKPKAGIPSSFRLDERTRKLIDGYAWRWGRTQAEVIAVAMGTLESVHGLVEGGKDEARKGRGKREG
jgi:hypothetical protein